MHQAEYHTGFVDLGNPQKIWAIPAIHAELNQLTAIHDGILEHFQPGDRILYHGNYTGYGADSIACIDELLTFRRLILSMRGVIPEDFTYLKGAQEEMLQKLLQLQFAPNPTEVLLWMLGNGISPTLNGYDICPHDGIDSCRKGIMGLTKWTNTIRTRIRAHGGHDIFMNQLRRAAFTSKDSDAPLLFVHAGINAHKPLTEQGDALWWCGEHFGMIDSRYDPFHKVVRGYDPAHKGINLNCVTATLDDNCGFGGNLICAGFNHSGEVSKIINH